MKKIMTAIVVALAVPTFADVTGTESRVEYVADGIDTTYDFTFKVVNPAHVEVWIDADGTGPLTFVKQTSGYTVALTPAQVVTFTAPPADDAVVRIQRVTPKTQTYVFQPYSAFKAKDVERAVDNAIAQIQEVDRRVADEETARIADKGAWQAADAAEASARAAAMSNETAARISADASEAGARASEDSSIRAQVASAALGGGVSIADTSTVLADGTTTSRQLKKIAADVLSLAAFLPVGHVTDGSVDYTAQIQNAIVQADTFMPRAVPIYLPAGTYRYTTLTNPMGHAFVGPGRLVKNITGGQQQTTSYADAGQYVFGREYLGHFHTRLIQSVLASKIIMSGDSTTAGVGASSPYLMDELVSDIAMNAGYPEVVALNRGHSSMSTVEWLATYLAADLAENPDVLVLRWGVNDASYRVILGNDRAALDQYVTNIRAGLATIRASKSVQDLTIILCTPNSTSDTPNGRDEQWYEQIAPALKQAARDYQAVYVDVYAYLRDTRNANGWMELTYAPDRYVHPLNVMNVWIASLLGDVLFPRALSHGNNRVINATNATPYFAELPASALPTYFPQGISTARAMDGNGWPVNGAVTTIRQQDGVWLQLNFPYNGEAGGGIAMRAGTTGGAGWSSWWRSNGKTRVAPTFGASVTINTGLGTFQDILASTGIAFTIANPTPVANSFQIGQEITIRIRNNSGGALGAITWGNQYRLATWTQPADGSGRAITFVFDGNNWWEINRTPADVPN